MAAPDGAKLTVDAALAHGRVKMGVSCAGCQERGDQPLLHAPRGGETVVCVVPQQGAGHPEGDACVPGPDTQGEHGQAGDAEGAAGAGVVAGPNTAPWCHALLCPSKPSHILCRPSSYTRFRR